MAGRLVAGALTTLALLLGPGVTGASAHAVLLGTTPAGQASVDISPPEVALEFSSSPQGLGTQVLVTGPDGGQASQGPVELRGTSVVQPLSDGLPAGSYTVDWRVTSSDGHPLSGTFTFAVLSGRQAASATPSAAPSPTASTGSAEAEPATAVWEAGSAADDGDGLSALVVWAAAGAIVVATGVVVARRLRRRS